MADMKTTQERRDRFREWLHDDTRDHLSIRAWCVAEDACQDVDTLLAEVAKLRAVAEAARAVRWEFGDDYKGRFSPLDEALEALEAP